jgi:hypothetical protein
MTTLLLKINERTKAGKAFIAMSETFLSGVNGIEIIEKKTKKGSVDEGSAYNPEFVKMVLTASKSKNRTRVNSKNLWESI